MAWHVLCYVLCPVTSESPNDHKGEEAMRPKRGFSTRLSGQSVLWLTVALLCLSPAVAESAPCKSQGGGLKAFMERLLAQGQQSPCPDPTPTDPTPTSTDPSSTPTTSSSASALTFSGIEAGSNPPSQSLTITNTGAG